ncbi:C-type lectin 37Db-like [Drosophila eugracilis]|uniref:C-type lectin 37Db-like n=1 Tax=Drosophila eugracilis TaxID=29029 RepID=UPI001BDADD04|nr:C-type lectin 37Db-like [Drosophila eugracilis]
MKVSKVFKPIVKFEKIGEKYYHIENKERLNWYEAVSRCRSMEANLISLQNEEEWKAITKQIRHYNKYWVDINDEATEGEYISESTGEEAPFLKWSVEEPNNSKGVENCVQMRESYGLFDETPHSMNDVECTSKTFFICEANEI